jgi:hypothetical protein
MRHERYSNKQIDGGRGTSRTEALREGGLRAALGAALSLGLLAGILSVSAAACGGEGTGGSTTGGTGGTGPGECKNGIIIDDKCVAKCTPDKCLAGNVCVDNECKLTCTAHTDCNTGTQDCAAAKEDDTMADVLVCTNTGRAPQGVGCPFGKECGTVTACPDGKACDYAQCGGAACTKDAEACGDDASCTIGTCPDMSPCTVPACPADQCKPMVCRTAGEGDANAYCSINDCHADAECPGGYKCGLIHDPHGICDTNPPKGDNNFCGKTAEPCIAPADFEAGGATLMEGSLCLLRKACTPRIDCDSCETDLDCSQIAGQHCIPVGPNADKRCVTGCKTSKDCGPSYTCTGGNCVPRFAGGCIGMGNFCEPCQNDEDCGSKGTTKACVEVDDLTGERACLDLSFPDMCTKTSDCPKSPGGKQAICGTELGAQPGDSLYNRCYLPYNGNSNKFGCW